MLSIEILFILSFCSFHLYVFAHLHILLALMMTLGQLLRLVAAHSAGRTAGRQRALADAARLYRLEQFGALDLGALEAWLAAETDGLIELQIDQNRSNMLC